MQIPTGSQRVRVPRGAFVGLTTVDMIFGFDMYPNEDTKNTARQYTVAAGGPASNAAVVFAHLGGDAQLVSSLGQSDIADIARTDLTRQRVKHIDITVKNRIAPALSAIAIAANNGSRTIFTSPAIDDEMAGPFRIEDVLGYVRGFDIVLLDGHQTMLATHVARQARELDLPVVLDGDLYQPDIEGLLPFVDIVIFGKSFKKDGMTRSSDIFSYFGSFGIKHVAATHGSDPIEFVSDGFLGSVVVDRVNAVDTLAAGDFFHGAFCYFYSTCRDIQKSLKFAARVATASVMSFGTRGWMRENESYCFEGSVALANPRGMLTSPQRPSIVQKS